MFKVFLLALGLSACSKPTGFLGNVGVFLEKITIVSEPKMNQDSATPLDIVIVYDPNLLEQLLKMSASDYFIKKNQLLKDNPSMMEAISFEVVPTQVISDIEVKLSHPNAEGAIVFANYNSPGDHRFKMGRQQTILIRMKAEEIAIEPED
jgi:type VI secretion system protein